NSKPKLHSRRGIRIGALWIDVESQKETIRVVAAVCFKGQGWIKVAMSHSEKPKESIEVVFTVFTLGSYLGDGFLFGCKKLIGAFCQIFVLSCFVKYGNLLKGFFL